MNGKRVGKWVVIGVLVIGLIAVVITAATTGSEASNVNSMLTNAKSGKVALETLRKQLSEIGFKVDSNSSSELNATGPGHWALIYGTWLVVHVSANTEGKVGGYEMNRESKWF